MNLGKLDFSVPSRTGLRKGFVVELVVPSPKGNLVSFDFLSRHSRAGLWTLRPFQGLVCRKPSPKGMNQN